MGIRFLVLFLVPLALQGSTLNMHPQNLGTACVVSWSMTISTFLAEGFCANVHWANMNHTFLNHQNCWTDTFLRDISPAELRSTALVWIPQGISNSWIKVDCYVPCASHKAIAGIPCYKNLCSGILNVPLPYGKCCKVSPEGRHIFEWAIIRALSA